MLRKLAVALFAATVFTAPALAQGTTARPAQAVTNGSAAAPATTPKVVTAKPTLKSAKVTKAKRYGSHYVKHTKHVKSVKRVKHPAHVKSVKAAKHFKSFKSAKSTAYGVKSAPHATQKSTTPMRAGAMTAPKSPSGVN